MDVPGKKISGKKDGKGKPNFERIHAEVEQKRQEERQKQVAARKDRANKRNQKRGELLVATSEALGVLEQAEASKKRKAKDANLGDSSKQRTKRRDTGSQPESPEGEQAEIEHEEEKLLKFVKRVGDLSSGWQSSEIAIKQELGEDIYKDGNSILAIINQKYASRGMSLDLAEQIAEDSDVIRSIEHTLEYAKRRSELRDKASETFKTIQDVRQYLESHQEEMPRKLREDIEFPLNIISTKYFDERIEFSSPSLTGTIRRTKLSPEGEELLRPTKEILPNESLSVTSGEHLLEKLEDDLQQYESLSQIKEYILEYEKKELPKFVERVGDLSADWQSSETAIARVFGEDTYEDGKRILAGIIGKNYSSKEMNLELTKEIKDDNISIRSIEVKLEYIKRRAEIPWLETPEDPERDRRLATEIVARFRYLQSDQVLTMFNRARSLDKWIRGNDPRVTPDIIEKIGQSLAQTNRTFALNEDTEKGNHQRLKNLTWIIGVWDEYRKEERAQPPIYPRDLPLQDRRDKYIYLIDPSKITIDTRMNIGRFYVQEGIYTPEKEAEMIEDASKRLKILLEKMKKKFASFLKDNNIFPDELWRLGIDEQFQREDPISSVGNLNEDKDYDPEPYFLLGTMQGLAFTFARIGRKLTPEYYQALHYECMKDNKVLWKKRVIASHIHGFRDIDFAYDKSARPCFRRFKMKVKRTASGLEEAHQNYNHRYKGDPRYKDQGHPLGRALSYEDPHLQPDQISYVSFTEEECKANTQCIFDKYDEEIEQARHKIANRHRQKKWHKNLAKNLSKEEIEELLTPIAHCCRDLELSHFFRDGNARAASFCILTKLLIENGLPLAIMPNNPWRVLEGGGIEEIVYAIRRGIAKGQTVLKRKELKRKRSQSYS